MSEQEVIVNKYERLAPIAITHAGGVVDVSGAMTALSIKEDIFTNSLSAKMAVVDASDSLGVIEFEGSETFKVAFKSVLDVLRSS